ADGRRLAPEMPSAFYRGLTDADLDAVVAYLRSVPAVDNRMPAPVYHTEVEPEAWPTATPPDDGKVPDEPAARGAYLANAAYCMNCHGRGADARFDSAAPGHGGLVMRGPWGAVAVADITGAALAGWTDAEIDRALSQGVDRNGESFIPPMNRARFYSKMTPNDRAALITWLRKL
ncbi:MAG: c-type cytochrome, partial [Alphaproteobacteria bacterium]